MKKNPLSIVTGALLLLIFGLQLFMFQVRVTEVAVVTTFGKPTRDITEPGLYGKWPWPIQKIHRFDKRVHNFESKFEQIPTADNYSLLLMVYAGWSISDPKVFFPRFDGSVRKAEDSLEGLVRNAYSGVGGNHPFSHFVSTDPNQIQFAAIEREILERIQKDVQASGYGIQVDFLGIKQLNLPESVTESVFNQMRAEREVLVSQIRADGTERASTLRTAAELESAQHLADAQAEATKIISLGEAEAAKWYKVFEQKPELAKLLLKLTTLEAFLKENTTLILDKNTSPIDMLQLPGSSTQP